MKKLSLNLNLEGVELDPEAKKKTANELVTIVAKNIILNYAAQKRPPGLSEEERRVFYKISDAFDAALKSQPISFVALEDNWYELIIKAKKEAAITPDQLLRRVEALIDEASVVEK